jgi:hypothetical protein
MSNTHPYAPTDLGTVTVVADSHVSPTTDSRRIRLPAAAVRALDVPDRISIVEDSGTWYAVAGVVDDGIDYNVRQHSPECRVSSKACRAIGVEVGDRVRFYPADGDRVRIERVTAGGDRELVADGGRPSLVGLTGFQRDVLVAVRRCDDASGVTSGQRVKAALEATGEYDSVQAGRLYPNLDTLDDRGLIAVGYHDGRTKTYRTTDEGRAALRGRVEQLVDAGAFDRATVLTDGRGER